MANQKKKHVYTSQKMNNHVPCVHLILKKHELLRIPLNNQEIIIANGGKEDSETHLFKLDNQVPLQ